MEVATIMRPAYAATLEARGFTDRCTVQRQNLVDDNRGGQTPNSPSDPWPTVVDGDDEPIVLRCLVSTTRLRPTERVEDSRLTYEGSFDIGFELGTDIRIRDRVIVSTQSNRVFDIIGPRYAGDEVSKIMAAKERT